MQKMWKALAAAFAAVTSACEDGPATVVEADRQSATWSSMVYATSDGPMLLQVFGNPFAAGAETLPAKVAAATSDAMGGRPFKFTLEASAAPHPDYRVILLFNPPKSLDAREVCAGRLPPPGQPAEDGRIGLLAAYCDRDRLFSSVSGWVRKVDGPDDPRFRQLLGQTARDLFGSPPR